jgi:glucokinase
MQIVAADIGGTHARFALADVAPDERPIVGAIRRYRTREHDGLASAWAAFERDCGAPLPRAAALAIAAPIEGDTLTFMNSDWRIARASIATELGLESLTLLNDFGAAAQAVSELGADEFAPVFGPGDLPEHGIVTVLGPGTGLGVAILDRRAARPVVIETEASHIAFAPLDAEEQEVRDHLVARYGRASVERIVSGPGLVDIYAQLGGGRWDPLDAGTLWGRAIDGGDPLAARALGILVRTFGAVAGDIALAHGAMGVAITGGLANRIAPLLRDGPFLERFLDKGRYRARMARIAVTLVTHEEPGLLGAAIAYRREHLDGENI